MHFEFWCPECPDDRRIHDRVVVEASGQPLRRSSLRRVATVLAAFFGVLLFQEL